MTPQDYDYLRSLLKERSGLVLAADKQYLMESRLLPLVRKAGLDGLGGLVASLKATPASPLCGEVVEAMTTNESYFFRDKIPFEHFRTVIVPALVKARAQERRIRIWCTAAAGGQEPYSLAMMLCEMNLAGWRLEILGTDIASSSLAKAKAGLYSQFEVQRGLPIQQLLKYFTQVGDMWQIVPALRGMVTFRPFNLLHDFSRLGIFDVIFCRNVLIYFDQPTKASVLDRVAQVIAPDGYLTLGAAETVVGLTEAFRPLPEHRGLYRRAEARAFTPALAAAKAG